LDARAPSSCAMAARSNRPASAHPTQPLVSLTVDSGAPVTALTLGLGARHTPALSLDRRPLVENEADPLPHAVALPQHPIQPHLALFLVSPARPSFSRLPLSLLLPVDVVSLNHRQLRRGGALHVGLSLSGGGSGAGTLCEVRLDATPQLQHFPRLVA
jgi:hypothetical protein